ncbi:RHS repeat-associated core domain-containing protein, partial [Streptomyces sp. NPDC059837]|uniref:RHS repeat-associated core domain-containing protein n=1 Tax=Streptomyces sp. NPDC059837 TaxID=3346968 RepID=UPI0036645354
YDANGDLLIRRGPDQTVLYLAGQELHYDTTAKSFSAQRYYAAGGATAVRTETSLNWMVDDHHGTASMTVDSTTQAITRRYTKPFGEARGAAPSAWPDDKGFLGKPADADTGLTHIGAREYDPATGRFLSVDPVLAADDHESLNGYAYANNTPVTLADPSGLRPDGMCGGASSSCNGGTETWTKSRNGWDWGYTKTYTGKGTIGGVTGTFTAVVTQTQNSSTAKVTFKEGPEPVPVKKSGNASNLAGHLAGIGYGLDAVSDLANPFCWFDSDSCSATDSTDATYDKWANAAGADSESSTYKHAWNNGFVAPMLALGGRLPEDNPEGLLAAKNDVENLSMTKTVENHTWDIAGTRDVDAPNFGKAARPYMNRNNGLLLREVMEGSAPRLDSRGAPGVVEWRTPGAMNGSNGIWELNIDTNSNKIVHFLFKGTKG